MEGKFGRARVFFYGSTIGYTGFRGLPFTDGTALTKTYLPRFLFLEKFYIVFVEKHYNKMEFGSDYGLLTINALGELDK